MLIDYRPALKNPSGVGEYCRGLVRGLLGRHGPPSADRVDVTVFSSSWKDRFTSSPAIEGAQVIDRRVPVSLLNLAWHRLEWPPIEQLTEQTFDVVHSLHPLLIPARSAAQIVTVHDLNFLTHPERTRAEIRRDYPLLAKPHAQRADAVVVPSQFTALAVERELGVGADRIAVCPPGAPQWNPRTGVPSDGYILFFGTLEPRKNLGTLLDAYEHLLTRTKVPQLVVAGQALPETRNWLDRMARPPLAGNVRHLGYVQPSNRRAVYEGARLLVQPSFEEGFGLPVLEAMTVGVPVIAANSGALPEVLGAAGLLVNARDPEGMAAAMERMLGDESLATACAAKGVLRSQHFQWASTAERLAETYRRAIDQRASGEKAR